MSEPDQPSIFDGLEGQMRSYVERPKPLKAVAHGSCPRCTTERVGLVIQGGHLVWKDHYVATWGSVSRPCVAGGIRLCDEPARDTRLHTGMTPPTCKCMND